MENEQNKILSYYEVQVMLPDYAFNRLSKEEKIIFEKSIFFYPDLQKELEDVQNVFRKVEQTDFDGKFARRTRNLSVDVINKYQKKKYAYSFRNLTKYLVPTLGVFIIILFIWKGDFLFKSNKSSDQSNQITNNAQTKDLMKVGQSELSVFFDTLVAEDDYLLATGNIASTSDNYTSKINILENNSLEDVLSELYSEEVIDRLIPFLGNEMIKSEVDFYHIMNEFENIEFNDLQMIIQELENVKIPS